MTKILIVDDSEECLTLVKSVLSPIATVRSATSLQHAREALAADKFDLVILDLNLPDGDGMEFYSKMQGDPALRDCPVIFLTARMDSSMQAAAFSLDVDDYVTKPIKVIEFRARIESRLRKLARKSRAEVVIVRGSLRIDLEAQKADVVDSDGEVTRELDLTSREFKLLCKLARHEGTLFSREQLISAIWGTAVHVVDRTVDTHIHSLRKKLGPLSRCIESEIGRGYRFSADPKSMPKKGNKAAA